jgi:hypothetical protein
MAERILYLFPDTNVFVQCRALEHLDWSEWKEFGEIHLLVTRPIQSEIDNQKNRGNDRLGKRARAAASIFRDIILGDQPHKVIVPNAPVVKLLIKPDLKRANELDDQLDYALADDQLVGIAYAFQQQNPEAAVRVLTHDGGPMATAKMVGVRIAPVPDAWLLEPESTEQEKEVNSLRSKLTRFQKAEPEFKIALLDKDKKPVDRLEFARTRYEPLTKSEVAEFMQRIKAKYPLTTDFTQAQPGQTRPAHMLGMRALGFVEKFTPPTEREIAEYKDVAYPNWLEACEQVLTSYHERLQRVDPSPSFCFAAENRGARPAKDALVTISAKGNFKLEAPSNDDDNEAKAGKVKTYLDLPRPPKVPSGTWTNRPLGFGHLDALESMQRYLGYSRGVDEMTSFPRHLLTPDVRNLRRDKNAFYYKPKRPLGPVDEISFECEQWRHAIDPEVFAGHITWDDDLAEIKGALECQIHAENMSDPTNLIVPVRIQVSTERAFERAKDRVDMLVELGVGVDIADIGGLQRK